MEKQAFNTLAQDINHLQNINVDELELLTEKFPWFHLPYMFIAKKLHSDHDPFFGIALKKAAIQNETSVYMDKTFLVGTGFPVYQSFYDTELTGNMENNIYQQIKIVKLDTTDMEKFDFVIYGNIMNEIPLQVRDSLRANWITVYNKEYHRIHFEVFRNRKLPDRNS